MKHISLIVIPGALGSAITIPLEMCTAANDIARARKQAEKMCRLELVGTENLRCMLTGNLSLDCHKLLSEIKHTDLVFVPAVWRNPRLAVQRNAPLLSWLQAQSKAGATLCAVTNGVYLVAAAGLLDKQAATTHWRYFDEFEKDFPAVKLQRKRFITYAEGVYCSGSVNAIRDITIHLIEKFYGADIALEVSRQFMHELKRSYESQLLEENQQSSHHDERVIEIQEWLQGNYGEKVSISRLAEFFGMSVRTLNRRFRTATNTTPLDYLQSVRLDHAKDLLKHSNLNVSEIAHRVGYQDGSYFSELFSKLNRVTPKEYRRLVRNKQFRVNQTGQPSD